MELTHRNFFGDNGITSTSANYIANRAKEYYQENEAWLKKMSFIQTELTILGSGEPTVIKEGYNKSALDEMNLYINTIIDCKRLIAYLREAIKEKERMYKEAQTKEFDITEPDVPFKEDYLTQEDIFASWTKEKLEKYYSLEAEASELGKVVHPDGYLNLAKKEMNDIQPLIVNEKGRDTVLYRNTKTVSLEDVDVKLSILSEKQRKAQAELNGMKNEIDILLREDKLRKDQDYEVRRANYRAIQEKILADTNIRRQKLCAEVQALKIVIPDELKQIYECVK